MVSAAYRAARVSKRSSRTPLLPQSPADVIGSIYQLLGIDPDGKMPNPQGLDVAVMPAGAGRLTEIL